MPNIVKCFFDVKKRCYYMFSSVEAFHDGLGKSKQVVIGRLSSSETWLMLIEESYIFKVGSQPLFNDPSE